MFAKNRVQLLSNLKKFGIVYVRGGSIQERKWTDTEVDFRQESNFYYLTGCEAPDHHLILEAKTGKSHLFIPEFSSDHAVWHGPGLSIKESQEKYNVDFCHFDSKLQDVLTTLEDASLIHALEGTDISPLGQYSKYICYDFLKEAIAEARVFKSKEEIELLREAARISTLAHIEVMKAVKSGVKSESELQALFEYICFKNGAKFQAYTPILAGGKRAAILHYNQNTGSLPKNESDFLLIDSGCEYKLYASDITRTYPCNGKFEAEHKAIYEIVLDSQKQVLKSLKPGIKWEDMHRLAYRVICEGLVKLGILVGNVEELIQKHIPALFFPHGLGHFLGIDVHDSGGYPSGVERIQEPGIRYLRMRRTLEAGMVVTVEPGLYFIDALLDPALNDPETSRYLNKPVLTRYREKMGGVRIEDDIVITETGIDNLTVGVPKEIKEIEAVMQ